MNRPFYKIAGYLVLQWWAQLLGVTVFRYRCAGRENIPRDGGVLVCSNHQSYFDPVVVGLGFHRRLNYLARDTLFRFLPFRWLIRYLDAIPIDRTGMGLAGLKETLRRLKRGEIVLIFPEGTRTRDGEVGEILPGFCSVARRSKATLLPVGFDGAYESWPRGASLPRVTNVHVQFGEPIDAATAAELSDDELVSELRQRIVDCFEIARASRRI